MEKNNLQRIMQRGQNSSQNTLNFKKRIKLWSNTLQNKSDSLRYTFGVTLVLSLMIFTAVIAFSEYNMKDLTIVMLLIYSVIGCVPFIEVAQVKNDDSFFTKRLTILNWKNEIRKNGTYNILSSNLNILNSVFPVVTILCLVLFFVNKIFGDAYVNFNTILIILLIQTPFNTALGLNPLGVAVMRQNVSKHITQDDLKKYLGKNKTFDFDSISTPRNNGGTPILNIRMPRSTTKYNMSPRNRPSYMQGNVKRSVQSNMPGVLQMNKIT